MSEQQEEILYFVKESIELENKQIQEVIIGYGSIYIFEKGNEQDENLDEDHFVANGQNSQIMDNGQQQKEYDNNQQKLSNENKQIEKKKSLFLDFDHKLELPFAKTLILNDNQKRIQLLIVAKNGEMYQFKIAGYQQKAQTLDIPQKEEKQIKNAKIIENSKLLITYSHQIFLVSKVNSSNQ